jgi:hypothetical protein
VVGSLYHHRDFRPFNGLMKVDVWDHVPLGHIALRLRAPVVSADACPAGAMGKDKHLGPFPIRAWADRITMNACCRQLCG